MTIVVDNSSDPIEILVTLNALYVLNSTWRKRIRFFTYTTDPFYSHSTIYLLLYSFVNCNELRCQSKKIESYEQNLVYNALFFSPAVFITFCRFCFFGGNHCNAFCIQIGSKSIMFPDCTLVIPFFLVLSYWIESWTDTFNTQIERENCRYD